MSDTYSPANPATGVDPAAVLGRAQAFGRRLMELRRRIHERPELGFREEATAELVESTLRDLGARVRSRVGGTGVVAEFGPESGPAVVLRADMDALPIGEASGAAYASRIEGVMHACGHDAHVACLLGAAMLLAEDTAAEDAAAEDAAAGNATAGGASGRPGRESQRELPGGRPREARRDSRSRRPGGRGASPRLRLLFQPSEETVDEAGRTGAQRMIEDGALVDVALAISLHVDGTIPCGMIGVESGYSSGAEDEFRARILGRGGHGARPHETVDPVWIGTQVLAALYAVPSRCVDPLSPRVLSIGKVSAGEAHNVIPSSFSFEGTIRAADEETRATLEAALERCLGMARALGGDFELKILRGCPPMRNDAALAALVSELVGEMLGPGSLAAPRRVLTAEDFAFVTALVPGLQFRLGAMPKDGRPRILHSPDFDLDEDALPVGAALLYASAMRASLGVGAGGITSRS